MVHFQPGDRDLPPLAQIQISKNYLRIAVPDIYLVNAFHFPDFFRLLRLGVNKCDYRNQLKKRLLINGNGVKIHNRDKQRVKEQWI
jgi:hypothetical protein